MLLEDVVFKDRTLHLPLYLRLGLNLKVLRPLALREAMDRVDKELASLRQDAERYLENVCVSKS